jgi:hypothetical protein
MNLYRKTEGTGCCGNILDNARIQDTVSDVKKDTTAVTNKTSKKITNPKRTPSGGNVI